MAGRVTGLAIEPAVAVRRAHHRDFDALIAHRRGSPKRAGERIGLAQELS
jgi:hypothetical protein